MRPQVSGGPATSGTSQTPEHTILALLTTHGNLTAYLTGGVIFPTGAQMPSWNRDRHHNDLSSLTPELLPLFTQPPGEAMVEAFIDTSRFQHPVLIEFQANRLHTAALLINETYQVLATDRASTGQDIAVLINGLIPTSYISQIVFRSEAALADYQARLQGNFEPKDWEKLMISDPGRFNGALDPDRLTAALKRTEIGRAHV